MTAHATGDRQDLPAEQPRSWPRLLEPALNPLQRLIQQRLRERGWSYGEVAKRGGMPRSTLYTLATTRNLGLAAASRQAGRSSWPIMTGWW